MKLYRYYNKTFRQTVLLIVCRKWRKAVSYLERRHKVKFDRDFDGYLGFQVETPKSKWCSVAIWMPEFRFTRKNEETLIHELHHAAATICSLCGIPYGAGEADEVASYLQGELWSGLKKQLKRKHHGKKTTENP